MVVRCSQYDFQAIEHYWQDFWLKQKTFKAQEGGRAPKYYVLDMFPYPSGTGLHIGHPEGYTASDILGRYKKAKGFNVLHPMGWDAFGLPAEQHAITTGIHPAMNTEKNIENFRSQIQRLGFAIDWDREISTTWPSYYRWTQWIFLQLFKHGLAYVDEKPVWWCPMLETVLANEEVIGGKSERGNFPVERRQLRQWVLRITRYGDKLLDGLKDLDWPEATKRQQSLWIGRSEGALIEFPIEGSDRSVAVFTTRPDTICGVSFIALAPEHPDVDFLTTDDRRAEIQAYRTSVTSKSDLERTDLSEGKSGIFTGRYVLNPLTGTRIPVWIADYVLPYHGTGSIMGVPAHDERDFEFAQTYLLEIKPVLRLGKGMEALPFCDEGTLIHSGDFSGLTSQEAQNKILEHLEKIGRGKKTVQYKLHDWLFSRQRYWGEPFPIVWVKQVDYHRIVGCKNSPFKEFLPQEPVSYQEREETWCALPLTTAHLPVQLPDVSSFKPTREAPIPLQNAHRSWLNVKMNVQTGEVASADGQLDDAWIEGTREINTMPQWAGSCWYHLRYLSPHEENTLVNKQAESYWGVPDFYIGGAEHAVLHLLYARFWHRFLFDTGVLNTKEPFPKLFHPGVILGTDGNKMSKSRRNVVNPDTIVAQYGADTLRLYEMFLGPLETSKPWSVQNIEGVHRFLKKIWRIYVDTEGQISKKICDQEDSKEIQCLLDETIEKTSEDIEHLHFNTAISQLMIFINGVQKAAFISRQTAQKFLQLLAPFAPHIAEELWVRLGEGKSISEAQWPSLSENKWVQSQIKMVVQVNGKVRDEILVNADDTQNQIIQMAKRAPKVLPYLERGTCVREIYVPHKLINLVVR
ncbi:MAG: leucine--tRNA ligase [Puniceicoccales bacterium]|jgi:leucyl-tRNA synthetase|nr:leucine--tRNA ligase [Puniceicoccales bacterium]